jgi:hypothetical protein
LKKSEKFFTGYICLYYIGGERAEKGKNFPVFAGKAKENIPGGLICR